MLIYKDYIGHVKFDDEANVFHGEVINTRDVITFQGRTPEEIKQAFIDSIEDYLEFCALRKENPEKPFSGKLNLRLAPELHKRAYAAAKDEGVSLNTWIVETIQKAA
jgi:predicted HicB family RNase H-like nuclease